MGLRDEVPESRLRYAHGARLVIEFLKRGHEVSVITPCEKIRMVTSFKVGRCHVYLIPQRRTRWQLLTCHHREVMLMLRCIRECNPDVAFAQWPYMYSRAALISGIPTLVVGRDSPWRVAHLMSSFRMWHRSIYSKLFVAPKLKNLTTISPHMVDELKSWWGKKDCAISVIPNAIPDGIVCQKPKKIKKDATTIACVSDWNELKNVKTLLRAFVNLHREHPNYRLVVYGASMLPNEAAGKWMQKSGLPFDGIDLRGYGQQEDIRRFLFDEADVFCSPSLEESFGMVFLEAMAQGVPCLGGKRSGAVPWLLGAERDEGIEQRENVGRENCSGAGGVVCDVSNSNEVAKGLEELMRDSDWRRRLSENGVRRARFVFNMDTVVTQYEKELKRVTKGIA